MDKRYIFSSACVAAMFLTLVYLHVNRPPERGKRLWTKEKQREYADKLKAEGLGQEAVREYRKYLDMGVQDKNIQANVYYTIGKIAEDGGRYEEALSYFYKVELINPDVEFKARIGEHIVSCLEKMGRGIDAENALSARTSAAGEKAEEGRVVARIGKERITDTDINRQIQKMPEWMRKQYGTPEKKGEFLRQYIAMELLSRKAQRLGYGRDPDIRQKLSDMRKELIVQKLVRMELRKRVKVTEDQVRLYYEANKDKYKKPARIKINYKTEKDENFKELNGWIEDGQTYVPDIGEAGGLVKTAFKTEEGKEAGPVTVKDKTYIIKVVKKEPERIPGFDEVKDRCSYDYNAERQDAVYRELLQDTLKSEDVEIYGFSGGENEQKDEKKKEQDKGRT